MVMTVSTVHQAFRFAANSNERNKKKTLIENHENSHARATTATTTTSSIVCLKTFPMLFNKFVSTLARRKTLRRFFLLSEFRRQDFVKIIFVHQKCLTKKKKKIMAKVDFRVTFSGKTLRYKSAG